MTTAADPILAAAGKKTSMLYHDILPARICRLNRQTILRKKYIVYWMQQSQRIEFNHALEYAIRQANELDQPLIVVFILADYPEANARHYTFMLEGLREVQAALRSGNIEMLVLTGYPPDAVASVAQNASLVICDCGYLRHQRTWRNELAQKLSCRLVQVESDVIIPVEALSRKAEYAAYTIRPKFNKKKTDFLVPLEHTSVTIPSLDIQPDHVRSKSIDLDDIQCIISSLDIDHSVENVSHLFQGGASNARQRLDIFIHKKLQDYAALRNQPAMGLISHMSMYLHFGQISPLQIALEIDNASPHQPENKNAFLEELTVRRELAINHVYYHKNYDQLACLPAWVYKTLNDHRMDARPYVYDLKRLESAQTHDDYWNAAMREMTYTGYMHGYMRMYWGKKIFEWSASPEEAFRKTLYLNNKYFLDGRDPNSYAGVGWIYGLHDRP